MTVERGYNFSTPHASPDGATDSTSACGAEDPSSILGLDARGHGVTVTCWIPNPTLRVRLPVSPVAELVQLVSMPDCLSGDPGSNPGLGDFFAPAAGCSLQPHKLWIVLSLEH